MSVAKTKPTPNAQPRAARAAPVRTRLAPEDREYQIVQKAIAFFASRGFEAGSTRHLAEQLGVSQALLYRYFPTKDLLIERVYEDVFLRQWNPEWEEWLADRSRPLADRLKRYYKDYTRAVLSSEWVRIFVHAGLMGADINKRYMTRLRERHFVVIAREMRHEYQIPEPVSAAEAEDEIELIWASHASIFYLGLRKWIYGMAVPKNLERMIDLRVEALLAGAPPVLMRSRAGSRPNGKVGSTAGEPQASE